MTDNRHLVIRALAGAGKTQSLSLRYLRLLRGGADPGRILATTFTRKAAGEILSRVLTLLAGASADDAAAHNLGRQLKDERFDLTAARNLLELVTRSMHRVQVSTLDACFHRMAMCYRFELGLGASPRLIDAGSPLASQLRRQAIDAMLAEDEPGVLIEMLRNVQHDEARRSVSAALDRLFGALYEPWQQTQPQAWRQLIAPPTLEPAELAQAIDLLSQVGDELPEDKHFPKAWRKDLDAALGRDWTTLLSTGLGPKTLEDPPVYQRKEIPGPVIEAYRPIMTHARAAIVKRVAEKTRATADLIERFDRHYRRLRREKGVILFGDLPHLLDQAFVQHRTRVEGDAEQSDQALAELYYRLDQRTSHLLLDEFQDTSAIQWRIISPIAAEICAGMGADHGASADQGEFNGPADPRAQRDGHSALDRSFFCVGDPKQAIFGWRGGQAKLFETVIDELHLPESSVHTNTKSYRSAPAVLDVVNDVFTGLPNAAPFDPEEFPKKETKDQVQALHQAAARWEQGFAEHHAHDQDRRGYVELAASPAVEGEADSGEAAHAGPDESGASEAESSHHDYVADRVADLRAAHPARTIGVLVRTNSTAVDLLRRLRERGIATSTDSGAGLDSDPVVELILSGLTLADHPGHRAAAFHVLHSPLAEALGLHSDQPVQVAEVAGQIRRQLLDLGYSELLTDWARQLSPICNRASVERLTQLIELAQAHEAHSSLRVDDFINAVRVERVPDPAQARVRLLTVHKAKGLEFDITVLAELNGLIGQLDQGQIWRDQAIASEPANAVFTSVKRKLRPVLFDYEPAAARAFAQEQASRAGDDLSTLYVAMTRARHALYMFPRPLEKTKRGQWSSKGLTNASFASVLRAQLTDLSDPQDAGVLYIHGDPQWDQGGGPLAEEKGPSGPEAGRPSAAGAYSPALPRLDQRGSPKRSWPTMTPSRLPDDEPGSVAHLLDPAGARGRELGTRIHALLEQIDWLDKVDLSNAPAELQTILQHQSVKDALSQSSENDKVWRERCFAVRLDHQLCQGKFDRVVITQDGSGNATAAHLIDFKTQAYSEQAVERYQGQLRTYRQALRKLLDLPESEIRTTLLFVSDGTAITH